MSHSKIITDILKKCLTTQFTVGSSIFLINIKNRKYSPLYKNLTDRERIEFTRQKLNMICIMKGMTYGSFFPISFYFIAIDILKNDFDKHIIPGSVYGKK